MFSSKKKKANIDESPLTPKKFLHNSSADNRSEKSGHFSKGAAPAFHHDLHELAGMNKVPESYCCLSKRSPVHFGAHAKSKSAEHPFVHLKSLDKTDSALKCLNQEDISLKVHHPLSCNIGRSGGKLKKRSRIFSWQRRKMYKSHERSLSIESKDQNSRVKDKTGEDYTRSQQFRIHSCIFFFTCMFQLK